MKLKLLLSTLIFVALVFVSTSQLATPASAITPITGPITSAMRQLSGVVKYLDSSIWRFLPADGATVKAENKTTGETFVAPTNSSGEFLLSVPPGKYMLWVDPTSFLGYKFVPTFKNLPVIHDFLHLHFFGLPL